MSAVKSVEANTLEAQMAELGANARAAAHVLAVTPAVQKRRAIKAAADALEAARETIVAANEKDMAQARAANLNAAMLDRLALDTARIDGMIQGLREVAALDDPVGRILDERTRPNGLRIQRVSVPVGVIGIIY
ncbi:MAG: gamma-glutamyl-phosphate reductase, partial [Rhodospirillaceae bacterium]|nr:gamma-glutamyl-phosphate reductase [Rhodospirillaceae bacterium]